MVIINAPSPAVVPSALLFTICFLFFFFLFPCNTTFVSAVGDQYCAPSSCGNLTNIRYPFRLKDDPPNCGDPNYELTCDDLNHTVLTLFSHSYYVTNIIYYEDYYFDDEVSFNIQVEYVEILEKYNNINNASCSHLPLPASPLTFSNLSRNNHYWAYDGWVTLVNCSKEVKNETMPDYYYRYRPVPCLSHDNNSFIYYLTNLWSSVGDVMPSCRFLAMFPYNNYIYWDMSGEQPVDIFKFLVQGFTLIGPLLISRSIPEIRHCLRQSFR